MKWVRLVPPMKLLEGKKSIQVCMSAEWKKLNSRIRKNITIRLLLSGYEDVKEFK